MINTSKTRTQRRMEKRQAVILLVLILVVSLVSFTLGVIVGGRGAERDLAQTQRQTKKILIAEDSAAKISSDSGSAVEKVVKIPPVEPVSEDLKLSFYDNLTKKTVPIGSGINLPQAIEPAATKEVQPPIDLPEQPIVKKEAITVVVDPPVQIEPETAIVKESEAEMPKVTAAGSHAVQIGSFNSLGDAVALRQSLFAKDYPAFVVEADLGDKGLWYRVRVGPYADASTAGLVLKLLTEKEQLKGFVTRQ